MLRTIRAKGTLKDGIFDHFQFDINFEFVFSYKMYLNILFYLSFLSNYFA